jgi:diguanylate cyclase (GGDEF)-like protein
VPPVPSLQTTSIRPPSIDDRSVDQAESRGLQWLLVIGAVLNVLVWVLEWRSGLINDWDRWLMPVLASSLCLYAALLRRVPAWSRWIKLAATLTFNAYIVVNILLLLDHSGPLPNMYQFLSTMYWLPLAYGTAFVFLPVRWALWVAAAVFVTLFGPLAHAALAGGAPTRWPEEFATLVMVLCAAQIAYIVLLRTVATVRADYQLADQRMRLMQSLAATDVLTSLPNRRAMTDQLAAAIAHGMRHGKPVTVALFDVDHFKRINDQFGHGAGDQVLIDIGKVLSTQLRASDHFGRWGGEEFLLVASDTTMHVALDLADRLRRTVGAWEFRHGQPVTVSIGVSQLLAGDDADSLLQRADRALYRAKEMGRNRTEGLAVASAP